LAKKNFNRVITSVSNSLLLHATIGLHAKLHAVIDSK